MTRSERRSRTSDAADSSCRYTYYAFDGVMNYSNKAVVAVRIKEQDLRIMEIYYGYLANSTLHGS